MYFSFFSSLPLASWALSVVLSCLSPFLSFLFCLILFLNHTSSYYHKKNTQKTFREFFRFLLVSLFSSLTSLCCLYSHFVLSSLIESPQEKFEIHTLPDFVVFSISCSMIYRPRRVPLRSFYRGPFLMFCSRISLKMFHEYFFVSFSYLQRISISSLQLFRNS